MTKLRYLLDSNTFSALVRRVPIAMLRYRDLLAQDCEFLICPFVYYEVRRGMEKVNATRQLSYLEQALADFRWEEYESDDWRLAATTWAKLANQGQVVGDTDIFIAVYAARRGATIVTHNIRHFQMIGQFLSLSLDDWFETN